MSYGENFRPGGGGSGLLSVVFVTNVTGAGTISNKTYLGNTVPASKVLTAFESDNDSINVLLELHVHADDWQPADVTVSGGGATPVVVPKQNWVQVDNTRIFTATATLTDATTTGTITATMSDGDTATTSYTRSLNPPLMLSMAWDNQGTNADPYPAIQTQFKNGDTMVMSGTCESHADEVYIYGGTNVANATRNQGLQGPFAVTAGVWGPVNVTAGDADDTTARVIAYCKVTGGTNGPDFDSEVDQTSATASCSQTLPTFSSVGRTYPVSQEALKASETCDVSITHTNKQTGDTHAYTSPGSEISIPSSTTYAVTKTVSIDAGAAGTYVDDTTGNNYTLTATRTTLNGKSASVSTTVEIADLAAFLGVDDSSPSYGSIGSVARMGTDNGTNGYRDRNLYIISNQKHLSTSTSSIVPAAGDSSAFTGSWVADDDFTFRRAFRVEDGDIKSGGQAANNFTWITISFTNRAGTTTTSLTKNTTYSIGGFQEKTLTIPAWPNREADIGLLVVDTAKLTIELLSKGGGGPNGGTLQTFDNSPGTGTPDDEVDKACISDGADTVDDDNQYYYNKDQAAAIANSSGTAQVVISESV